MVKRVRHSLVLPLLAVGIFLCTLGLTTGTGNAQQVDESRNQYAPLETRIEVLIPSPQSEGGETDRLVHVIMISYVQRGEDGQECVLEWRDQEAGAYPPIIAKVEGFIGFLMSLKGEGEYPLHGGWERRVTECSVPTEVDLPITLYTEHDENLPMYTTDLRRIDELEMPVYLPSNEGESNVTHRGGTREDR